MDQRSSVVARSLLGSLLVLGAAIAHADPPAPAPAAPPRSGPSCDGAYAEDLAALSVHAREIEAKTPTFSYAIRTSATYECLSYGGDAAVVRARRTSTAHGTAFGYRRDGGDTLLLTNDHVASWPIVTDDEHAVPGVPTGCKRVSEALWIVDNDHDDYAADDIPLARVASDPQLDIAVLRAKGTLPIIPWKVGKSAGLHTRDVVEVKGFPLGAFRATNTGKVTSALDHDDYKDWNHDDFVVDALLSEGNSGSPVLAVSCATGEFELVGVFHAHYTGGSALNVVVAIDQVRELMASLRPTPRSRPTATLDAAARASATAIARGDGAPPYFEFGPLVAHVHARGDGALVFSLFAADFPRRSVPLLVVEDLATGGGGFGQLGAIYLGDAGGLRAFPADGADERALVQRALASLRQNLVAEAELRAGAAGANASREAYERQQRRRRALDHDVAAQRDLALALADLATHATAQPAAHPITLAQIFADPRAVATVPTPTADVAAATP